MKTGVTKLIPENIKPPNAKKLAIYDGNTKICDVDISSMIPKNLGTKLYSFGLLSDIHLRGNYDDYPTGDTLDNAMTFFENQGCSFCCNTGDLTMYGYYKNVTLEKDLSQMAEYKEIRDKHPNLPMYGVCGNHESFNKVVMNDYAQMVTDTGHELYYTIEQGDDLFIFIGQPSTTSVGGGQGTVWEEEIDWLANTLKTNQEKRCFIFSHPCLADDSGNPNSIHSDGGDGLWMSLESRFISTIKSHPNAILFHGHSHLDFCEQLNYSYANYSTRKGIKSVHIPSIYASRIIVSGEMGESDRNRKYGYIAEAYTNHLVLMGYDFLANEFVPIAQYCIKT